MPRKFRCLNVTLKSLNNFRFPSYSVANHVTYSTKNTKGKYNFTKK